MNSSTRDNHASHMLCFQQSNYIQGRHRAAREHSERISTDLATFDSLSCDLSEYYLARLAHAGGPSQGGKRVKTIVFWIAISTKKLHRITNLLKKSPSSEPAAL